MRRILLAALASLPWQTTPARPPRSGPVATRVQVRGADCALFPAAARLDDWGGEGEGVGQRPRFTPTPAQAAEAEQALAGADLATAYDPQFAHMRSYYARYPVIIKQHLPDYRRQYVGFFNARHQPCLFVNCFYNNYSEPRACYELMTNLGVWLTPAM